jgi:hypothetical protein
MSEEVQKEEELVEIWERWTEANSGNYNKSDGQDLAQQTGTLGNGQ